MSKVQQTLKFKDSDDSLRAITAFSTTDCLGPESSIRNGQTLSILSGKPERESARIHLYELGDSFAITQGRVSESVGVQPPVQAYLISSAFTGWIDFKQRFRTQISEGEQKGKYEFAWSELVQPIEPGDRILFFKGDDNNELLMAVTVKD